MKMNIFVGLVVLLLGFALVQLVGFLKFRRIRQARRTGHAEAFEHRMKELAVPEAISAELLAFLRRWMRAPDLEVRSEDDLAEVFGLADDDVFDALREMAVRTNRRVPEKLADVLTLTGLSASEASTVHTVEDLALLMSRLPSMEAVTIPRHS